MLDSRASTLVLFTGRVSTKSYLFAWSSPRRFFTGTSSGICLPTYPCFSASPLWILVSLESRLLDLELSITTLHYHKIQLILSVHRKDLFRVMSKPPCFE